MTTTRTTALGFSIAIFSACGDDGNATGSSSTGSSSTTTTTDPTTTVDPTTTTMPTTTGADTTTTADTTTAATTTDGSSSSSTGETGDPYAYDCDEPEGEPPELELVPWITDIFRPAGMAIDPDDPDRIYVTGREGQIHIIQDGVRLPELFLDLSDGELHCCMNDSGFGGMALHPDYANNGLFYVHYTSSGFETTLAEYRRSDADPDVADPDPVRELIVLGQTEVWHYGGSINFGADGILYYSRGDGGGMGDPEDDAENPMSRLGKIMRIDVDTFPEPPAGNMPGADPHVWSMGIRNAWRATFDPCTDELYIADVGQASFEEINVVPMGSGPHDFGWNSFEGNECYEGPCDDRTPYTFPVTGYNHDDGSCAIIGGYVYRGSAIPGLRGRYFYGDVCSRRVWSFRYEGGEAVDPIEHTIDLDSGLLLGDYTFASFGQDAYGEVYIFDLSGTIWRLAAR